MCLWCVQLTGLADIKLDRERKVWKLNTEFKIEKKNLKSIYLFGFCTFLPSTQTSKLAIVYHVYLVLFVLWDPVKIQFES